MNPLAENPKARKVVYTILWAVGLLLTAAQVYVGAVPGIEQPSILTGALAVFPAVAAYVGYTAGQNVTDRGYWGGVRQSESITKED